MQIDKLQVEDVFDLQIGKLSADGGTICQSKNCLETKDLFDWQIEEWYADQRTIYSLAN